MRVEYVYITTDKRKASFNGSTTADAPKCTSSHTGSLTRAAWVKTRNPNRQTIWDFINTFKVIIADLDYFLFLTFILIFFIVV